MTTLVSPGTSVTVIDESFYDSSGPGTVPLIFIATEENKAASDGSGVAEGTLKQNAGKLNLITSQRELLTTFGLPEFKSIAGTQRHAYELNEYGLLAAHSYLGLANRAYVVRGDVDLAQLEPSSVPPVGTPLPGQYWFDVSESNLGLFLWDDTDGVWVDTPFKVVTNESQIDSNGAPILGYPAAVGEYAWVAGRTNVPTENTLWRRTSTEWELITNSGVGPTAPIAEDIQFAPHTQVPEFKQDGSTPLTDGDIWIKTTSPNSGTDFSIKYFDGGASQWIEVPAPVRLTRDEALLAYQGQPSLNDVFVHYDYRLSNNAAFLNNWTDPALGGSVVEFAIMRHNGQSETRAIGSVLDPELSAAAELIINDQSVPLASNDGPNEIAGKIISASIPNITADVTADLELVIISTDGKDIELRDGGLAANAITEIGLDSGTNFLDTAVSGTNFIYSNWSYLSYVAEGSSPTEDVTNGTLWYNNDIKVDILINNGAGSWEEFSDDIFIQTATPSTGVTQGDLWIDPSRQDEYPFIQRYNGVEWVEVDNTDQTSPQGIIFSDARPSPTFGTDSGVNNGGGATPDLDPDRPDPLLYPKNMLLFNTRYSTNNVKEFVSDYTFEGVVVGDRWVTKSGNRVDGSPYMGRFAVKRVITNALAAAMQNNEDIRAESIFYNVMAAPGFPELIDEMVTLNIDRKETAFIVGDTPMRLNPTGTSIENWATNANNSASNSEEGLLTSYTYLGLYYPAGFTTSLTGEEVVVPASHIALRTIGFNDQVAYPWFAPAGYQRGTVTNAVNVGFVNDEDEFVPVELNQGQRDVLYTNNINPIAFRPNRGLVVFGQKTRHPLSSALDRVNVARLVNYIRYIAPQLAEPFLYQPNDEITRRQVTRVFERFLEELVVLRGLTDYAVICDSSNNFAARIDRNELWIDLVIIPTRSIDFIYIPVRVRNTGADLSIQQEVSGN